MSKVLIQKTIGEVHVWTIGVYGVGVEAGESYDVDVAYGILHVDVAQSCIACLPPPEFASRQDCSPTAVAITKSALDCFKLALL